ncbi:MAG: DUF3667 domain-containing protein [Bacteroidota bacterium]
MSESNTCVNCGEEVIGKHCHYCGQKYGIVRLTWATMFDDLQQRLFGFDNKYVRTVRDLTLRPRRVVQSILDGIRVIYIGPVGFYFLMLTLYLLIASMLDVDLQEMMMATSESINGETQETTAGQQQLNNDLLSTVSNNFRIFSFLMVPFFTLSNMLFFRKAKMNFVEHTVVVFYGLGWPFILSITFLFVYAITGWFPGLWASIIVVLYYAWICTSVYAKNKILGFIKGIFAVALAYLILVMTGIIIGIIYTVLNPEFLETFAPSN